MAWHPQIVRTDGPTIGAYEAEFLASEFFTAKRLGMTIDYSTVPLDADGNRILNKGTAMGRIDASGKYGPYSNSAVDGRATAKGFLAESCNVAHGDVTAGLVITGSVIADRCSGLDASGMTELASQFTFQ